MRLSSVNNSAKTIHHHPHHHHLGDKKVFSKNLPPSLSSHYNVLISCKKSEKTQKLLGEILVTDRQADI